MHEFLNQKNVNIKIYDKNPKCVEGIKKEILLDSIEQIKEYPLIMDATNEGGWLSEDMLHKDFMIGAPGIPLSLNSKTYELYKDRILHDWLQIGVAVMIGELCH